MGANLEVEPGQHIAFVGPNGAGKTTTFYIITGVLKPDKGSIHLNQKDIKGQTIKLKRGQLCCSISYMANNWNWKKAKAQRYLEKALMELPAEARAKFAGMVGDTEQIKKWASYNKQKKILWLHKFV